MELITSGNPNLETIKTVLAIVSREYKDRVDKVLFIDNEYSIKDINGNSIEGERNNIVRAIFGKNIKIESVLIDLRDIHTEIPKILCDQLKNYSKSEIIVDITNGNKYISSILYASASLIKVDNIISIIKGNDNKYILNKFKPIDNIDALGKYAYFEIIYYSDLINIYIDKYYRKNIVNTGFLRTKFRNLMGEVLEHYFSGKYEATIYSIGRITEALLHNICTRYNLPIPQNRLGINTYIGTLRKALNDNTIPKESADIIRNITQIAEIIRNYRNPSVHPNSKPIIKIDSKFILDIFLYLLHLIEVVYA